MMVCSSHWSFGYLLCCFRREDYRRMFEEPFTLACLFVAVVVVVVVVAAAVVVAVVAVVADALFKVEVRRFPWSVQTLGRSSMPSSWSRSAEAGQIYSRPCMIYSRSCRRVGPE